MSDVTLAEFLAARLDEDEAAAKAAAKKRPGPWQPFGDHVRMIVTGTNRDLVVSDGPEQVAEHIVRHDPARVLRDVEAGRKILALHQEDKDWPVTCLVCLSDRSDTAELWRPDNWPCPTLRHLAAVYSDHPDYREEWRP